MKQLSLFVSLFCGIFQLSAQYTIHGHLNLTEEWQPKVYLAAIDKLSDYYRTSPDMIVGTSEVASDGSFELTGNNLPDDDRFYRLYLMKKQNTDYDACLYVGGDDHNFAHLILNNRDELEIATDSVIGAPFGNYHVIGSRPNQLMRQLASIVYPSFYFYRIKFPTELKFSEDRLHADLMNFADTCANPLVALAAINNTDFDEYFDRDRMMYESFSRRLQDELPGSVYTGNFELKCRYYANEEFNSGHELPAWGWGVILLLGLAAISGWWQFVRLSAARRISVSSEPAPRASLNNLAKHGADASSAQKETLLTPKESEIYALIVEGKSNKEIARTLFVELSTVKTHINKLYGKLGVKNRKEAQMLAINQETGGD